MNLPIKLLASSIESTFDHDTFGEFKSELIERIEYLTNRMSEVYELDSVDGIPELQYAVGDVMNLLDMLRHKVQGVKSESFKNKNN